MATNDPSRTISIHGDKYTYDSNKKKWMSGKKEATAVTSAMLDLILKQLQPKQDEVVDSFVGTANIVPSGGGDKEYEKEQDRNDEKREKREEDALESTESPAPKTEEQPIKPEPIASDRLVAPAEELKEQPPERKISSGMEALLDAKNNIVSMVKDRENWFKPEKRESLESVEDLSRSEKNRLEKRGISIDADSGIATKGDEQLNTEQLLQELNADAAKRDEKEGTPFYKTKASQISQDFGTQFNKRLGERLPLLKLFSDKFDGESDAAAVGDTGAAGGSTSISGLSDSVVDSLKSIDEGVQDIIDILKENQKDEEKDDTKREDQEQDSEVEKEKIKQEKVETREDQKNNIESIKKAAEDSDAEQVSGEDTEENKGTAYNLGKKTKKGINKVKEGFGKIKSKLGFGEEAAEEGAAEAVGEGAAESVAKTGMSEAIGSGATEAAGTGLAEAAGTGVAEAAGTGIAEAAGTGIAEAAGAGVAEAAGLSLMDFLPLLLLKNGGVVNNITPFTAFADGGVVDSPTAFSHEDGVGVMGEAGPEAVMPLQRGDDGKLGVKAADLQKPAITDQTNTLNQAEEERQRVDSDNKQPPGQGHTIINQNNNNTSGGSGGSGAVIPTAGNRNSLDLYYFAA